MIATRPQVLQLAEPYDAAAAAAGSSAVTRWRLADVRANATAKGRRLSKRQRALVIEIPVARITSARVFVDF